MALKNKKEDIIFTMFKDFAMVLDRMGTDFATIVKNYQNVERAIADLKMTESECDIKFHKLLQELNGRFITPFDREDIFTIANQLDDLADYIEDTASKFQIYDVDIIKDDAVELGKLIDDATTETACLFENLPDSRKYDKVMSSIIEINRLEDLGDAASFAILISEVYPPAILCVII